LTTRPLTPNVPFRFRAGAPLLRSNGVRTAYGIEGGAVGAFCTGFCCAPCATCQQAREIAIRGAGAPAAEVKTDAPAAEAMSAEAPAADAPAADAPAATEEGAAPPA
jgi:hypothetical protein